MTTRSAPVSKDSLSSVSRESNVVSSGIESRRVRRPIDEARRFDDFLDSYHSNPMTRLALAHEETSLEGPRLARYLTLAHAKAPHQDPPALLPADLEAVLALQLDDGRWEALSEVRVILDMDPAGGADSLEIDDVSSWEEATALALAFIRQHAEHHAVTEARYLRGAEWVDARLVRRAVEVLLRLSESSVLRPGHHTLLTHRTLQNTGKQQDISHSAGSISFEKSLKGIGGGGMPRTAVQPPVKSSSSSQCVDSERLRLEMVSRLAEVDVKISGIQQRLASSAAAYRAASTVLARADCFLDLVLELGDGGTRLKIEPQMGQRGQWGQRQRGQDSGHRRELVISGLRPLLAGLFDAICADRSLLNMRWSGVPLLAYISHCLDFLGGCPELCDYFGRTFPYQSNPLMLHVNTEIIISAIHKHFSSVEECILVGETVVKTNSNVSASVDWKEQRKYELLQTELATLFATNRRSEWPELSSKTIDGLWLLSLFKRVQLLYYDIA